MTAKEFAGEAWKTCRDSMNHDNMMGELTDQFQEAIEHGKRLAQNEISFSMKPIQTVGTTDYEKEARDEKC